jgi:sugar phosphate isomerase/epimerase
MAQVRLGVNNGFALKRWPEPSAWADVVANALGLRHVQLSFDVLDPGWPEASVARLCDEVREAASARGLAVDSTFTGLAGYAHNLMAHPDPDVRRHARRWFESGLAITARLGAGASGGHMGALSARDHADPGRRARVRRALVANVRSLARMARQLGLRTLLWEAMPVPRELPHTPAEAEELMAEVNDGDGVPVRLCFDLGHCCGPDLPAAPDPHAWLERLLPWTGMIHLQQTDGRGDHHWPFTPAHAATGIVDPRRVVEIARRSPLDTIDLVLELCHPHEAPDAQVVDDHRASVDVWTAAGATP